MSKFNEIQNYIATINTMLNNQYQSEVLNRTIKYTIQTSRSLDKRLELVFYNENNHVILKVLFNTLKDLQNNIDKILIQFDVEYKVMYHERKILFL